MRSLVVVAELSLFRFEGVAFWPFFITDPSRSPAAGSFRVPRPLASTGWCSVELVVVILENSRASTSIFFLTIECKQISNDREF